MGFKERLLSQIKDVTKAFSADDAQGIVSHAGENIFGFYSPSGGNGVTTLVVNIADALRVAKKQVAVIDFDLLHPQCFRYLSNGQEEAPASITDRWISPTTNLTEFAARSLDNYIAIYSARLEDDVYTLAELDIDAIKQFIQDVAKIYDFVLLDIHGTLNDEATVASLETCTEIFTIIRPTLGDLENAYKDNLCAMNFSLGARFVNLIQSPVHQLTLTDTELKELDDVPFKIITNIPFVNSITQVGQNYQLFLTSTIGTDNPSVVYRQSVKFLAEMLLNYHAQADQEIAARKEAANGRKEE